MSSDILRFAANCSVSMRSAPCARRPAATCVQRLMSRLLGLPLLATALACGFLRFVHEERFDQDLLFDLVKRPGDVVRQVPRPRGMTRTSVAIFTDNDFEKVNGVTTALSAVLDGAPDDVDGARLRGRSTRRRLARLPRPSSWGVGIPFYPEMRNVLRHRPGACSTQARGTGSTVAVRVTAHAPVRSASPPWPRPVASGSARRQLPRRSHRVTVRLSGISSPRRLHAPLHDVALRTLRARARPSRATVDLVVRAGLSPNSIANVGPGHQHQPLRSRRAESVDWRRRWRAPAVEPSCSTSAASRPRRASTCCPTSTTS